MAALFPPGALPSEVLATVNLLRSAKGKRLPRIQVEHLVTPDSLRPITAEPAIAPESETMQVCRSSGLIRRDEGDLVLTEALGANLVKAGNDVRAAIRRTWFTVVSNEDAHTSNIGAGDLARAAAWFLLQDTWHAAQGWNGRLGWEEVQQRQLASGDPFLINDTRWGALERWLPFLGLAVHDHQDIQGRAAIQVLVPDPTRAVAEELRTILAGAATPRPIRPVLTELAKACPVLDGGIYHTVVLERLAPGSLPGRPGVLSPSLSHALQRLHEFGEYELLDQADAEKVLFTTLEEPKPFSHIMRRRGK